jgi:hypothetical protein
MPTVIFISILFVVIAVGVWSGILWKRYIMKGDTRAFRALVIVNAIAAVLAFGILLWVYLFMRSINAQD